MAAEFSRDAIAAAAVFGFLASAWFGWAQDQAPPSRPHPGLVSPWSSGCTSSPLAWLLHYPLLGVVGALVTLITVLAVPLARSRSLPMSAVTGLGCGSVLLAAAPWSLADALL
jgi:hypothetical protein